MTVQTVHWSDLCVDYVVLAVDVTNNNMFCYRFADSTVSYLFVVNSDGGGACVGCLLGHVFTVTGTL